MRLARGRGLYMHGYSQPLGWYIHNGIMDSLTRKNSCCCISCWGSLWYRGSCAKGGSVYGLYLCAVRTVSAFPFPCLLPLRTRAKKKNEKYFHGLERTVIGMYFLFPILLFFFSLFAFSFFPCPYARDQPGISHCRRGKERKGKERRGEGRKEKKTPLFTRRERRGSTM